MIIFLVLALFLGATMEYGHGSKFAMVNWIYNSMKNIKVVLCALHGIMLCVHGQIGHLQKLSILCL
jgi:nitrate/nitrite transporter NarK